MEAEVQRGVFPHCDPWWSDAWETAWGVWTKGKVEDRYESFTVICIGNYRLSCDFTLTTNERWNMLVCAQEKFPKQPSSDTPVCQILSHIRGHVKGLSGSLVLSTLLATLVGIFLIKAVFSWASGGNKPRPASVDHKTKKPKEPSETVEKSHAASLSTRGGKKDSEERKVDSEKSPRKRKWALAVTLCLHVWPDAMTNESFSGVLFFLFLFFFVLGSSLLISYLSHTSDLCLPLHHFISLCQNHSNVRCTAHMVLGAIGFEH